MAVMVLTTVEAEQTPVEARYLLNRTRQEIAESATRAIMEMITTIVAYRFETLTRVEVEAMLNITFKETRLYQDIKQEAQTEGREEGREEGRQEEAAALVTRLLAKRFGDLSEPLRGRVSSLPLSVLEDLGEALLDFTRVEDLQDWLEER